MQGGLASVDASQSCTLPADIRHVPRGIPRACVQEAGSETVSNAPCIARVQYGNCQRDSEAHRYTLTECRLCAGEDQRQGVSKRQEQCEL